MENWEGMAHGKKGIQYFSELFRLHTRLGGWRRLHDVVRSFPPPDRMYLLHLLTSLYEINVAHDQNQSLFFLIFSNFSKVEDATTMPWVLEENFQVHLERRCREREFEMLEHGRM